MAQVHRIRKRVGYSIRKYGATAPERGTVVSALGQLRDHADLLGGWPMSVRHYGRISLAVARSYIDDGWRRTWPDRSR